MNLVGVGFLVGLISVVIVPIAGWLWISLSVISVIALIYGKSDRILPVVIITGQLWALAYLLGQLSGELPDRMDSRMVEVSGEIVSVPVVREKSTRFDFLVDPVLFRGEQWSGKVTLSWYHPDRKIRAGQRWRFMVKLKPVHGFANPGGFDYESWLYQKGISATGYVRNEPHPQLLGQGLSIDSLRQSLSETVFRLNRQGEFSGILAALVSGNRSGISSEQWTVLSRTGTLHLMAISGLHIGLVFGLFYLFAGRLWRLSPRLCLLRPAQDISVVAGLIAAAGYAALAGMSIPTQRALIMLLVVGYVQLARRSTTPLDVLQMALLLVLLFDPVAVLSAGFWLSFVAVMVIYLALSGTQKVQRSLSATIIGVFKIQWVISLGLLPVTAMLFHQVSIASPLMNLVAVPVVSLIVVPGTLLAALASQWFPLVAELLFLVTDSTLDMLWMLLETVSEYQHAMLPVAHHALWMNALLILGCGLVILGKRWLQRFGGVILMFPLLIGASRPVDQGSFRVDILDVGQGLSVVVRTAHHVLLYDAGFSNHRGFDLGERVVIPYLRHEGVRAIDRAILSHDDSDHIGGFDSVRDKMPTDDVLVMPGSVYQERYAARACNAGQNWSWDGVGFQVLVAAPEYFSNENNRSCVLKVSSRAGSVLLTGDIENQAEIGLIQHYADELESDILLAPHHGSATSSSADFIAHVNPREVVFSSGFRNRFGFPDPDVSRRYELAGVRQWTTSMTGMIRYEFESQGSVSRQHYRQENPSVLGWWVKHSWTK